MKKWSRFGNNYYPATEATLYEFPKTGVYKVIEEKSPAGTIVGLQKICDKFEFDYKLYDLGTNDIEKRIRDTWNSELYKRTGKNLGIIYNGVKGTGKTVGAKILCNDFNNLPVLVISQYFKGISDFIQSIDFSCVVFIDEAEKIFDNDDSECSVELLRMIDGVYSAARKIFILTTNSLALNENLLDRPSRIRYVKEFGNVSSKAVEEIIEDKLINMDHKPQLLSEIEKLKFSTIDIIENMIFEFNIHGNVIEGNVFNIPQKSYSITILKIDLKTYVNRKKSIIKNLDDVIELSNKLTKSSKELLITRGEGIDLKKILPNEEYVNEQDISFSSYVRNLFLEKAGLAADDEDIYFYDNQVSVYYVDSWSDTLFENLELENGDKIIEIKSGCFKAMRYDDPDDIYYGIVL